MDCGHKVLGLAAERPTVAAHQRFRKANDTIQWSSELMGDDLQISRLLDSIAHVNSRPAGLQARVQQGLQKFGGAPQPSPDAERPKPLQLHNLVHNVLEQA